MVFELFCIDSLTRSHSDINKRTKLFEMSQDQPKMWNAIRKVKAKKTKHTNLRAAPSKSSKAPETSLIGDEPSSETCRRWVGQVEGPVALSKETRQKVVFGAAGALK